MLRNVFLNLATEHAQTWVCMGSSLNEITTSPLLRSHCFGNGCCALLACHTGHDCLTLVCLGHACLSFQDENPLWSVTVLMTFYTSLPLPSVSHVAHPSHTQSEHDLFGIIGCIFLGYRISFCGSDLPWTYDLHEWMSQPSEYLDYRQCHQAWPDCTI